MPEKKIVLVIAAVVGMIATIAVIGIAVSLSSEEEESSGLGSRVNFGNAQTSFNDFLAVCKGLQVGIADIGEDSIAHACYGNTNFKCLLLQDNVENFQVFIDDCINEDIVGSCTCGQGVVQITNNILDSGCEFQNSPSVCTRFEGDIQTLSEENSEEVSGINQNLIKTLIDLCVSEDAENGSFSACVDATRSFTCNSGSVQFIEDCRNENTNGFCDENQGIVIRDSVSLCST